MREQFYRTSFSRHIHSVLINGFMARELDADDFEFLEQVKARGIANGSLPNTSIASLEELEFWDLPYDVAPDVERKLGPVPRPVETPEHRKLRLAQTGRWHARRVIREQERAIAAAELERERVAWEAANEKRHLQDKMSDAEWEAAAPRKESRGRKGTPAWPRGWGPPPRERTVKFGRTVGRHYVPQWKLDEQIEARIDKAEHAEPERTAYAKQAKLANERAKLEAEQRQREATAEQQVKNAKLWADQHERDAAFAESQRQLWRTLNAKHQATQAEAARAEAEHAADARVRAELAAKRAAERQAADDIRRIVEQAEAEIAAELKTATPAQAAKIELERRYALIAEARRAVDLHTNLINENRETWTYTPAILKRCLLTLIRSRRGHEWTLEQLQRTLACQRPMLDECLNELVRDNQLVETTPP